MIFVYASFFLSLTFVLNYIIKYLKIKFQQIYENILEYSLLHYIY